MTASDELYILSETNMENVATAVENVKPAFLIIDSIQTMYTYAIYSKTTGKYVLIENVVTIGSNTYRWVAHTYPNSGSMVYCCANINYFEYYDTDHKARDAGFADLDEANAAKAAMNAAVAGNGFDLKINMYEADTALDATNYVNDGDLVSTRTIHCKDNII